MKGILKRISRSPGLFSFLAVSAGLVLLVPSLASAQSWLFNFDNISFYVLSKILFFITWVISTLAAFFIMVEAWILGIILDLGTDVVNSPPVTFGFPVVLAFANLTLVLALLVIAVMTIVGKQGYGVKQALWKLIVIALLINFGLVIAGVILEFSDSLAQYFLYAINPGAQGFNSFATALSGAFNPQGFLEPTASPQNNISTDPTVASFLKPISGLIFTILALFSIVITLGALVIMLVIRYVVLGYLLIVLPVAWAGWIFPSTSKYMSGWWGSFIRQAFFAPIVLFFLWLAIMTSYALNNGSNPHFSKIDKYKNVGDPTFAGIHSFAGDFSDAVASFLNVAILVSLTLGGLLAANKLGIATAAQAHSMATGTFKWAGNKMKDYSKRKALQGAQRVGTAVGSRALGTEKARSAATNLQRLGADRALPIRMATAPLRALGRTMQGAEVLSTRRAVDSARKGFENLTADQIKNRLPATRNRAEQIAAIQRLHELKELQGTPELERYLNPQNKAVWTRYGMEEDFAKIRGESGYRLRELVQTLHSPNRVDPETGTQHTPEEIRGKISAHLRSAKSAGQLAELFLTPEKVSKLSDREKLPLGLGRDVTTLNRIQQEIMRGVTTGQLSGQNVGAFFKDLARGDQLEVASQAAQNARVVPRDIDPRAARRMAKFLRGNLARDLGIDEDNLGVAAGIYDRLGAVPAAPGAGAAAAPPGP